MLKPASLSRSVILALAVTLAAVVLLGLVMVQANSGQANPLLTPTPSGVRAPGSVVLPTGVPTVPVGRDLAPSMVERDKWGLALEYPDGRREMWLLPDGDFDKVRPQLPADAKVVALIPPASMMGREAPRPSDPGSAPRPMQLTPPLQGTPQRPPDVMKPATTPVVTPAIRR